MNTSKAEMREPTYFVLASLLDGPLHGYAIIKRTASRDASTKYVGSRISAFDVFMLSS